MSRILEIYGALSGNVPGGFGLFLLLIVLVALLIWNIGHYSGVVSQSRIRRWQVTQVVVLSAFYAFLWRWTSTPPEPTRLLICSSDTSLSDQQKLSLLNATEALLASRPRMNVLHNHDLLIYGNADSLQQQKRLHKLIGIDAVVNVHFKEQGAARLEFHRHLYGATRVTDESVRNPDGLSLAKAIQTHWNNEYPLEVNGELQWSPADTLWLFDPDDTAAPALSDSLQPLPMLLLARRALQSPEWQSQDQQLQQVLRYLADRMPHRLELQLLYARYHARHQEWEKVEQALMNALSLDPYSGDAYYLISHLLPERQYRFQFHNRLEVLQKSVEVDPIAREKLKKLIRALDRHSDLLEALAYADRAAFLYPEDRDCRFRLAFQSFRLQRFLPAIEIYEELITDDPNDVDSIYNLAITWFMIRDYKQAIPLFQRVLELGGTVNAHNYLAKCYAQTGDRERGIWHLRERIRQRQGGDDVQVDEAIKDLQLYFPEKFLREEN